VVGGGGGSITVILLATEAHISQHYMYWRLEVLLTAVGRRNMTDSLVVGSR
jgi:hypothetical protein